MTNSKDMINWEIDLSSQCIKYTIQNCNAYTTTKF